MKSHESLLLIRMLRYQGSVNEEQLQLALSNLGADPSQDEILQELVELGFISQEWSETARRYLKGKSRGRVDDPDKQFRLDRRFGQLALERGWIGLGDLETAILEQEKLRRVNLRFRIGEILMRNSTLTIEQVREILLEQGLAMRSCENCGAIVNISALEPGNPPECPCCTEGGLSETAFLETIRGDVG